MSGVVVTASAGGGGVVCTDRGGLAVGAVGTSGAELGGATGISGITIADDRRVSTRHRTTAAARIDAFAMARCRGDAPGGGDADVLVL